MPDAVTRLTIEQEVLRILKDTDPEVAMVPIPMNGVIASAGDTITAPRLDRGTINANRFDSRLIKVAEDATALAFTVAVTVSGAHTAATTSLTVSSAAAIAVGYILELNSSEKVLVRAISGSVLTVTRGYQDTTAAAYSGGETVRYDPFGFVTGVDDGGFAAGGVLTISPNFAAAADVVGEPYAAGNFHMYPRGYTPEEIADEINIVLRHTEAPYIWGPSLVIDSDFASNSLTNWDDVLTPTKSFVTSFTAPPALDFFGDRLLLVSTNATGEGVTTESIHVDEGEVLVLSAYVSTAVYATVGTSIIIRDNTNSQTIESITDIQNSLWTQYLKKFAPPSGCKTVKIRFLSGDASGEFYIAPPVIVQSGNLRQYQLPSWFVHESQLIDFIRLIPIQSSNDAGVNAYVAGGQYERVNMDYEFLRSDRDINPFRVSFRGFTDGPVYALVRRAFAELSGDSSTTKADKEFVAAKAAANLFRKHGKTASANLWEHVSRRRAGLMGYGGRHLRGHEERIAI